MPTKQWLTLVVVAVALTIMLATLDWFKTYEYVAIWLEGIALVAIFGLDFFDRKIEDKERERQHKETLEQLSIARQQTDAATEAALAAKKSADISAALHRPFVGLSGVTLKSGFGTRFWDIAFHIKNYGTLPAVGVSFSARVFTDDIERLQYTDAASFEIFPSSEFEAVIRLDLGEPDMQAIHDGSKKIRSNVQIRYHTEDGRSFEFTSEIANKQSRFSTHNSTTRTLPT
jgi:hypothetical protein